MLKCFGCGAEVSNGLALCAMCIRSAELKLEYVGVYFTNLSRWRPGRAGARPVPGSRVLWSGEGERGTDRVTTALDEAGDALSTWARVLADERPHMADLLAVDGVETEAVAHLCQTFAAHLPSMATTAWCGEFLRELTRHEGRLRELTEQVAPGWYAGGCKRCGSGTYVVPGLTWVTCGGCGATTYARDHLEVVIEEARDWLASPKQLAEAVVALIDTEASVPRVRERIKKWSQRGAITGFRRLDQDGDEVGPKRFRLGDVLDLVLSTKVTTSERMRA